MLVTVKLIQKVKAVNAGSCFLMMNHKISPYLNVADEGFLRVFFVVDARMVELVGVIAGHFGEAWLFNHPWRWKKLL
jgi:hypothetical protein